MRFCILLFVGLAGCSDGDKGELTDTVDGESGYDYTDDYPDYAVLYFCAQYAEDACTRAYDECMAYWSIYPDDERYDWFVKGCVPTYMEQCAVLVAHATDTERAIEALRYACATGMDYTLYASWTTDPDVDCETWMDPDDRAMRPTMSTLCPCAATGDMYFTGSQYVCED